MRKFAWLRASIARLGMVVRKVGRLWQEDPAVDSNGQLLVILIPVNLLPHLLDPLKPILKQLRLHCKAAMILGPKLRETRFQQITSFTKRPFVVVACSRYGQYIKSHLCELPLSRSPMGDRLVVAAEFSKLRIRPTRRQIEPRGWCGYLNSPVCSICILRNI